MTTYKRVSLTPSSVLDDATWAMYKSPRVQKFADSLRAQYDTGPEVGGQPPDLIILEIVQQCYDFLFVHFFDESEVAALPGPTLIATILPQMVLDLANCLAKHVVRGDMPRMDLADEVDAQISYIGETMRPKRGAPKAQEMRAFIQVCVGKKMTIEEMALEWWEQHPEENPDVPDKKALQLVTYRIKVHHGKVLKEINSR